MKSSHVQRYPIASNKLFAAITALTFAAAPAAQAASGSWLGATDGLWSDVSNWSASPVPGDGDTATFDGAGADNTTIDLGAGVTVGTVLFDTSSAAAYTIGSGAVGSQTLTFSNAGALTINSGVTTNQLFNANLSLNNAASATATITNNGSGLLTIAGTLSANAASGNGVLNVAGSGNITITGAVTEVGAGNSALKKTGSGTLTLSNGSTFNGTGASQPRGSGTGGNSAFVGPFFVQEGTLLLNGGTHTVTGEAVIGGIAANHGDAGQNAKLRVDSGALNISSWLSVGRGNGTGTATSDLEINNAATVTAGNLSAGFNGGSTLNTPTGTITLSGTSSLSITTNNFIAESAGTNFTVNVNGTSLFRQTAAGGGETRVAAADNAVGTINVNGGTVSFERDAIIGYAGTSTGRLNLTSGTVNMAGTTERWLMLGRDGGSKGEITIDGGTLNLNTNTDIRFGRVGTSSGTSFVTLNGGNITGWTGNGTGAFSLLSVIDLNNSSTQATFDSSFNLNGGTLTIGQVITNNNNGNAKFNFNGGTLRPAAATTALIDLGGAAQRVNVRNGGAIIDTNGVNVTIPQPLLHSNIGGDNATDGGLSKIGVGTLTLSGVNTYTGDTTIGAGGTLALASTGSIATSAAIIANGTFDVSAVTGFAIGAAQTLKGSGTVVGATTVDGTLAPGNSPGVITFSGDLSLGASATSVFEINGLTRGTEYDGVNVGGALSYGGTMSLVFDAPINAGTYDLFGGFSGQSGTFAAVSVGGTFAQTLNAPATITGSGWSASSPSWSYAFDNATGDLTVSAIPEPSTFAALAGLVGLAAVGTRRRRR